MTRDMLMDISTSRCSMPRLTTSSHTSTIYPCEISGLVNPLFMDTRGLVWVGGWVVSTTGGKASARGGRQGGIAERCDQWLRERGGMQSARGGWGDRMSPASLGSVPAASQLPGNSYAPWESEFENSFHPCSHLRVASLVSGKDTSQVSPVLSLGRRCDLPSRGNWPMVT